jgi:uncharacterized membrane protein
MRLMLQALAFDVKGAAVTALERRALREAVNACAHQPLTPNHQILREAANACLASDPLTDDVSRRLHAALLVFRTDKISSRPTPRLPRPPHAFDWQKRRDLA